MPSPLFRGRWHRKATDEVFLRIICGGEICARRATKGRPYEHAIAFAKMQKQSEGKPSLRFKEIYVKQKLNRPTVLKFLRDIFFPPYKY